MARSSTTTRRRWSTVLAAAVVALAGLPLVGTGTAAADTAPVPPVTVPTASADSLPTVQINGIVWDQAIGPGNRVYVVGEFTQARPAGAAAGTQQTARANILAYDLTTGNLISSWNPGINAFGRDVEVSPDGTRVYVGGNFTQASGSGGQGGTNQTRNRIAAFDAATGALLSFNPGANSRVKSVEAVGSTVYFGGNFTTLGGQARARLAATSTTGALLPWSASTDREVFMIVSPPGSDVVVAGGAFANANGVGTGGGLAAFDAQSGQLRPWEAYGTFPNNGTSSAIYSLSADAQQVYGTGYDFGGGSPFEGSFGIGVASGRVNWVNGCKGDTYDAVPLGGVLYSVGHPHDCAMVQGHPQTEPWTFQRAMAQTTTPGADGRVNTYQAYAGRPAPELLHWLPTLAPGSYSGSTQAAWTVDGNDDYVLLGGEFPTVNGAPQQGLARFAVNPPQHRQGPQGGAQLTPDGVSLVPGTVRVGWTAAWDRDNRRLTYEVLRGGAVVGTVQADSAWWKRDRLSFTDTGLTPGSTQGYRIRVTDAFGNTVTGDGASITVQSGAGGPMPYADAVRADAPTGYWRLGEPSGSLVYDWAGASDLTLSASAARAVPGPLTEADTATGFTGADSVPAAPPAATRTAPDTFTAEAWFKTATPGGKIIGFGDSATGTSSNYDRHVYMAPDGRVVFGVHPGGVRTVASAARYDDDQWHHVVATLGPTGQTLYVDGVRVGRRTDTTSGQAYSGVWRIGGDNLNGWPDTGSRFSFAGAIDEVAVYPTVLPLERVQAHYAAAGREVAGGVRPADAYGAAVYDAAPDLYWRLDETTGTLAADATPNGATGVYSGDVTRGVEPGGASPRAVTFDGTSGAVASTQSVANPRVYSQELWFRTTTTVGGKLIGFGSAQTGTSGGYDRHVYMTDAGRLVFGTWTGTANTIESPAAYNDGTWHHLAATQGGDGMRLYVDGALVGTNPQTQAQDYTGYWRVGGDQTWGSTSQYFAGSVDEVAVYPTVLTPAQVAGHHSLGSGQGPANAAPTAAFTAEATALSVAFDATGSTDPDGTVASYAWDFGDGTTGTGATPSHPYAAAGSYQVGLVVTDDDGAVSAPVVRTVAVTAAPVPNQPPVASFTTAPTGLSVAFDGTGSSDADGTVASYAWDFGDGDTATGPTAAHDYDATGTYTATLTVTDDDGATATASRSVAVTAPAAVTHAADAFGRTLGSTWGSADVGGAWSTVNTGYSVGNGSGAISVAAGGTRTAYLNSVSQSALDIGVSVSLDKPQTGGGTYLSVVGRRIGADDYRVTLRYTNNGALAAQLIRVVGGTSTTLGAVTLPGGPFAAGETVRVRFQVVGTGTTTLNAKVWRDGTAEPAAWTVSRTDTSASLQGPGSIGFIHYLSGSATSTPMIARFDDLLVTAPGPA